MRLFFLTIAITLICINNYSQTPAWLSVKTVKGNADMFNGAGKAMALDAAGNIYTTGCFQGTVDFDPGLATYNLTSLGEYDIFISKFDNLGNFIWTKAIGAEWADQGYSIHVDNAGAIYVTGTFVLTVNFDTSGGTYNLTSSGSNNSFILKLNSDGGLVWARHLQSVSSNGSNGLSVTVDNLGNVYSIGTYNGSTDFDPGTGIFSLSSLGDKDFYISKLDSSGNFLWAKSIGGINADSANSIVVDASGSIYLAGYFSETVDFDPNPGVNNLSSMGSFDIFIAKYDNLGNLSWAKSYGSTGQDSGTCISISSDDFLYVTGNYSGTVNFNPGGSEYNLTSSGIGDIFISKLDTSGNFIFTKSIGGTGQDNAISLTTIASQGVFLTGNFSNICDFDPGTATLNLSSAGDRDIFVAKYDNSGNSIWAKSAGGTGYDLGSCVATDVSGYAYLVGLIRSQSANFDSLSFTATNPASVFISKIDTTSLDIEQYMLHNEITVFPNPFSSQCTVMFESEQTKSIVKIIDLFGKEIRVSSFTGKEFTIEKENLKDGIYFLKITDINNQTIYKKIVVN